MNTNIEALEGNQIKIAFEIEASEVDARIKRTYKKFAKRYNFPGFRPGKAPRPVIDSMVGEDAVRATVTEDLVNELYPQILEENNYVPMFQAQFDYETDMVEEGNDFKF
ncbi:MAG: trigger factor family protein, partial [Anaerotardibacter sp.]